MRTFDDLTNMLLDTCLFTDSEIASIVRQCGKPTIAAAIYSAFLLFADLTRTDIDVMYTALDADATHRYAKLIGVE